MKKINNVTLVLLVCLSVFLIFMWGRERSDQSDILTMAQQGAEEACDCFTRFRDSGEESYYWYGVSSYYQFEQAYRILTDGAGEYSIANTVYGYLVAAPEKGQAQMDAMIEAMELLAQDVTHPNGHQRLARVCHLLEETP